MRQPTPGTKYRPTTASSVRGSIAIAALTLAFLVAVSFPLLALAAVLGAVTPALLRRGRDRLSTRLPSDIGGRRNPVRRSAGSRVSD